MKIMIVEDEQDIQKFIARALKDFAKEFLLPCNGQEAALLVTEQGHCPDLIITDMDMPLMNGLEMIQKIHDFLPHKPPFVLITGNEGYKQQALDLGAASVILKPFHVDELLQAVQKIFC